MPVPDGYRQYEDRWKGAVSEAVYSFPAVGMDACFAGMPSDGRMPEEGFFHGSFFDLLTILPAAPMRLWRVKCRNKSKIKREILFFYYK